MPDPDNPGDDRTVDDEIAALYALPLDEFTRVRDGLAKARRTAGDRDGAAVIKALRKPSVPAWALNQVARHSPEVVMELRRAGAHVRDASEHALSGDAADLRSASRDLNNAVADVADAAARVLSGAGKPAAPATYDRIVTTVRAAATDDELGDTLAAGVLEGDAAPAGFDLSGLSVPALSPAVSNPTETSERDEKEQREREKERTKLDDDIARHEAKVQRAQREVAELEARLAAALDRVDRLEAELDEIRVSRADLDE
jgi:hypothetical protein